MLEITSQCVAACHLTAKWTMSTDDGNRPYKKRACHKCISPTCGSWDLSLSSFVNTGRLLALTQSHFRNQQSLRSLVWCVHRDAYTQSDTSGCTRDLPLPQRHWLPAQGRNPHSQTDSRYKIKIRYPHLHLVCVCKPRVWGRPGSKEGSHWSNSLKSPPTNWPLSYLLGKRRPAVAVQSHCAQRRGGTVHSPLPRRQQPHRTPAPRPSTRDCDTAARSRERDPEGDRRCAASAGAQHIPLRSARRGGPGTRRDRPSPRGWTPSELPTGAPSPALPHRRGAGGRGGAWGRRCRRRERDAERGGTEGKGMPEAGGAGGRGACPGGTHVDRRTNTHRSIPQTDTPAAASPGTRASQPVSPRPEKPAPTPSTGGQEGSPPTPPSPAASPVAKPPRSPRPWPRCDSRTVGSSGSICAPWSWVSMRRRGRRGSALPAARAAGALRGPLGCAGLRAPPPGSALRRAPSADQVARRQEARASHMAPRTAGPSAGGRQEPDPPAGCGRILPPPPPPAGRERRADLAPARLRLQTGARARRWPSVPPRGTSPPPGPRGRNAGGLRVRRGRRGERRHRTPSTDPPSAAVANIETRPGSSPLSARLRPRPRPRSRPPQGCCFSAVSGHDAFWCDQHQKDAERSSAPSPQAVALTHKQHLQNRGLSHPPLK